MKLGLPIVWSDRHRLHEPGGEVWIGVRTPGTEVPRRAEAIRDALRARDAHRPPGHHVARAAYGGSCPLDSAAAAASSDPESPLDVTAAGDREAGRVLGALGLPTVLVQEGGYDLTTIGALVTETLAGVQEGATRA